MDSFQSELPPKTQRIDEEQFRLIAEAIPVPVILARISDGAILYSNTAASSILDCLSGTLLNRLIVDFFDNPFEGQVLLDSFAQKEAVQNSEFCWQKSDGTSFWVSVSLQPIHFMESPTILSLFYEITKYKQIEAELFEKKSFLQLVLDNIPQLIFWKDRNSVFLGCNRLWSKAAGLTQPDDAINKTDYDLYPNANPANVTQYLEQDCQVLSTGIAEYQLEYKAPKDVWYDTKKIPMRDLQGNIIGLLGTVEDVTKRKKAEEALRIAEENYRGIFENALEGIFQSTADGHYLSVNPSMARIYSYESPADMIAKATQISRLYIDPNSWSEFNRLMKEQGQVKGFEYQVYRQDSSKIWVEENTRAICDSNGKLLHYEGIIQDISDRKHKEEALQRQLQELRTAIDQTKQDKEVAEIVETASFQNLKQKLQQVKKAKKIKEEKDV